MPCIPESCSIVAPNTLLTVQLRWTSIELEAVLGDLQLCRVINYFSHSNRRSTEFRVHCSSETANTPQPQGRISFLPLDSSGSPGIQPSHLTCVQKGEFSPKCQCLEWTKRSPKNWSRNEFRVVNRNNKSNILYCSDSHNPPKYFTNITKYSNHFIHPENAAISGTEHSSCFLPHKTPHKSLGEVKNSTVGHIFKSCCLKRMHKSYLWISDLGDKFDSRSKSNCSRI